MGTDIPITFRIVRSFPSRVNVPICWFRWRCPARIVGISSIRVEPTWMILGQSAGIAAALAADQKVFVQDLPYPKLRARLLAQGQVLDLQ